LSIAGSSRVPWRGRGKEGRDVGSEKVINPFVYSIKNTACYARLDILCTY
jgi:hypothetical protein